MFFRIANELLARFPTVKNMYVSDVDKGDLQVFDESMPNTILKKIEDSNYKNEDYEIEISPDMTLPYIP